MSEPIAQRTLVKSPPELWAEISDVEALARHLGAFGEIRITRLVPETAVSWEGENARGTVELSAAGWGTKVTLTATSTAPPAAEMPAAPPAAPAAPEVPAAAAATPSAPAMVATPPTTPRPDHQVENPSARTPLDRTPPSAPADEPRWAASVEQKVRDRYVGAAPTTHRSVARDEPPPAPANPAATEASTVAATPAPAAASTVAATPAPAAVAPLPRADAGTGPPEKARPPRGLFARLKYWFTPPEGDATTAAVPGDATTAAVPEEAPPSTAPEEALPSAVPEKTTRSTAPDKTASGTPERATSAPAADTPSVTKPQEATPAAPEPREAAEPPRLQAGEPAELQDDDAIDATPAVAPAQAPGAPVDEGTIVGILTGVLDELGSAHHRPFSRG